MLFVLVMEELTRLIYKTQSLGIMEDFKVMEWGEKILVLQYVDVHSLCVMQVKTPP